MSFYNPEFYKGKKVLVTGGTGTIGSALSKQLLNSGAELLISSLDSDQRTMDTIGDLTVFRRADLRDYNICRELAKGQDYVFHLMAVKGNTQRGFSNVASAYVSFLLCNTNMMEAAFQENVKRFMFVGSIGQYPPMALRHEDDVWSGAPEANDRYMGIAKRAGEAQAEAYLHEFNWNAVRIVRLSNVYGPYDDFDPETAHVIPALIYRIINGENPLNVAGDGSAVRDFIFLEDVVDGILTTMEKAPACKPINIGSGKGVTIKELVETLVRLVPEKPKIFWDNSRPTGDSVRVLDVNRAREILGFKARTTLEDGLKKTILWYLTHKSVADRRGKELHG